jgi:hypothetical protein
LPSFSEPVQTALALLAIVPPWGIGYPVDLSDAPKGKAWAHLENCFMRRLPEY